MELVEFLKTCESSVIVELDGFLFYSDWYYSYLSESTKIHYRLPMFLLDSCYVIGSVSISDQIVQANQNAVIHISLKSKYLDKKKENNLLKVIKKSEELECDVSDGDVPF